MKEGVFWALLLKPFAVLVILGGIYFLGDWIVPRLERFWPKWLFRDFLFKRRGEPPQSPR